MIKVYKTEIKPNGEQVIEINKTINACRSVYNKFIEVSQLRYKNNLKFLGYMKFSVWYNNEYPLDTIVTDVHSSNKNAITIFVEMRSEYNDMEDVFISTVDNYINKLNFLLSNLKNADVRSTRKVVESIKKLK